MGSAVRAARALDLLSDPFEEQPAPSHCLTLHVLGGPVSFASNSRRLLGLVRQAFDGLPPHRLGVGTATLRVRLELKPPRRRARGGEPPPVQLFSGPGFLGGAIDGSNLAIVSPGKRTAVILVSRDMLRFPYHVRYELIEFAVYVLAARARRLLPLHAAMVGLNGRGLLLMGDSGAGKSTLALHCLLQGMELLSEDSVFVAPASLRAVGLANFLHVQRASLPLLESSQRRRWILQAPTIRRRSGTRKLEMNPRRSGLALAAAPLKIAAVVLLSTARRRDLLTPVPKHRLQARLALLQPYAARHAGWRQFGRGLARLKVFELGRGGHPRLAVTALRELLDPPSPRAPDT